MTEKIRRREFLKFVLTSGIVLTSAGGTVPLLSGCGKEKEVETKKTYNFLDHLDEAEVVAPEEAYVQKSSFPIEGEERAVLFQHPDAQVTFKIVPIFRKARLSFGIGINEAAWDKVGDGVQFAITLVDERSGKHSLYSRYLDPKNNPEDRTWFDETIDLKDFEGQSVSITFATSAGPKKDNSFAWAGWSEPQVQFWLKRKIKKAQHTNIIFITLDTTRADHVSCYGYDRETTPNLDRIAKRGFKFLNAISPSPWTLPAHASLFTSLFPSQHGAITKMDKDVLSGYPLGEFDFVLARLLKEQGLLTAGFVGGPFLKSEFGFAQGFDTYDDQWEGFDLRAAQVNAKVFSWLEENFLSPFFLFVNYFDPHAPYNPPADFGSPFKGDYTGAIDFTTFGPHQIKLGEVSALNEEDKKRAIDLYDTEILFMDYHLGKLLQKLEDFGLLDNSLIIITSDHGESFGENDIWGHGGLPIESQVRVPLIIFYPPQTKTPAVIAEQIQTTSIFSTILESLNIPLPVSVPRGGHVIDLLRVGGGEGNKPPAYTFAERFIPTEYRGMLRSNRWKYLLKTTDSDNGKEILEWVFDLKNDPQEVKNLLGSDKIRDDLLRRDYSEFRQNMSHISVEGKQRSPSTPATISKDMRERLKALGYVK